MAKGPVNKFHGIAGGNRIQYPIHDPNKKKKKKKDDGKPSRSDRRREAQSGNVMPSGPKTNMKFGSKQLQGAMKKARSAAQKEQLKKAQAISAAKRKGISVKTKPDNPKSSEKLKTDQRRNRRRRRRNN